jgi:type I restriction-modification system DNA methylase subunit
LKVRELDMEDTRKENERNELHRAIWSIAEDLRGSVDGWDFKNYVLSTMFYRYLSENMTAYINAGERQQEMKISIMRSYPMQMQKQQEKAL